MINENLEDAIYSKFKPLQYARKIGVNFGGGY